MRKLILLALVVFASSAMAIGTATLEDGFKASDQLFFEDWGSPNNWNIGNPPVGWVITDEPAGSNTGWGHYSGSNDDGHVARIVYNPEERHFAYEILMDSISFDATDYSVVNINMDFVLDYGRDSCDLIFQILVSTDDWATYDVAHEHTYDDGSIGYYDC